MKKSNLCLGMLAIILAFGMTVVGCDDGSGDPTPQTVTYSGTANGEIYTLKITEKLSRAAYAPQAGDSYVLTVGTKTSTGTVENVSGGNLTLKPSNAEATFTASISNGGISGFTGSITFDGDTTPTTLPSEVTPTPPSTGGTDPFAGTWEAEGVKIVAADGSFEASRNGKVFNKGTYTCEGNNVTVTLTHVNPWMFGSDDDQLYTWAALPQEYKDNPEINLSQIVQMTVTGNTFSWNGMTFTKQGGGGGNSNNPFKGTWTGTMPSPAGDGGTASITYVFGDTTFDGSTVLDNGISVLQRGNYTYTDTVATTNVTEINIFDDGESIFGWISSGEYFDVYGGGSFTWTLSNGQLTIDGALVLTKTN